MKVCVAGDENEIQIEVGGKTYMGDLHEASVDDDGPEIWQIDGLLLETDQILCLNSLESLARDFLEQRGIQFDELSVSSDSFRE